MTPACCITFVVYENMILVLLKPKNKTNGPQMPTNATTTTSTSGHVDSSTVTKATGNHSNAVVMPETRVKAAS